MSLKCSIIHYFTQRIREHLKGKPQNKSNFLSTSFANTEMYSHLKANATFEGNGDHLRGLNHVLYVNLSYIALSLFYRFSGIAFFLIPLP